VAPDIPNTPPRVREATARQRHKFLLLSHDLRSALADILGGVVLIERAELGVKSRQHLDRVEAAAGALGRLLDKTLADDMAPCDQAVGPPSDVDLGEFLQELRKRWVARAGEKGVAFHVEMSPGLPMAVSVDRVTLERILSNLIGNAIKFTDVGDVTLTVACNLEKSLFFRVVDSGSGLSPMALQRLFEYEGRPADAAKPGSGLGLYIAKELSVAVGAQLKISNLPDGGAEAVLALPHAEWAGENIGDTDSKSCASSGSGAIDLSGLRILLAEDNKTNQLVATQMLRTMGAQYEVASDGVEALDILAHETFNLALLDIEMPRMSGLELMKSIRGAKNQPFSDMPLIALTAYVMREHRDRIFAAGADGIIAKPVMNIRTLGKDILGILDRMPKTGPNGGQQLSEVSGVVDQKIFNALIKTIGPESRLELLSKLHSDTEVVTAGMMRGHDSLDLAEIRAQTHVLISVAGAIGATNLLRIAQNLNAAANREAVAEIGSLCQACLAGLSELQAFILDEQAKEMPRP